MEEKYTTIHYHQYLGLDQILNAQEPRSALVDGKEAHEEMLFIIVHQVYELWFKQILHELKSVLRLFREEKVDERNMGTAIGRLERIIEIQKLLIQQIRIMETMTPLDFLDFRNHLFPASGFQSYQFRLLENLLGLPEAQRLTYHNSHYASVFTEDQQAELKQVIEEGSLFDAVEDWLERTPFIQFGEFKFLTYYRKAVEQMVAREQEAIRGSSFLSDTEKEKRLSMLGGTDTYFQSVLNEAVHQELAEKGELRLSYPATIAALFINLYREEPILQMPFRLLVCLVEIDEAFTTWRYRHAQMVLRMLGNKIGTGGSSGHDYLQATAQKNHIFKDLHNISTLLIPRSELPSLPPDLHRALGFYFTYREWG